MVVRSSTFARRAALAGALLAAVAPGCAAETPPPAPPTAPALCERDHLDACEKRIASAMIFAEPPARDLVAAYAEARGASDPWALLFRDLDAKDRGPKPKAALIVAGASAPAGLADAKVRRIDVAALPAPGAIAAEDLLLAMAGALGYEHLVLARSTGITQLFPNDPLAPLMAGLRAALRDDGAHLAGDLAIEESLRAAFEAAASFRYLDAVRATEAASRLVDKRDPTEPVLRAKQALVVLGSAGLVLDAEPLPEGASPPPAPPPPPADPSASPYAAYLRVLSAKEWRKEWEAQSAKVLAAIAPDRRDDLAAIYTRAKDCDARRAVPMERAADLVFASRLSQSLARDPSLPPQPGQLALRDWLARYETMVGLVERTRTAWYYLPSLLFSRGDAAGLSPAGTSLYRRVTDLGLAHLTAIKAVEEAHPARYRSFSQMGLALAPGLLSDDRLRPALVKLAEASAQDKIATATDAPSLLMAIAAGAASGLSYPPALAEPHFLALAGAASARLKGDFLQKTGWGVALLYTVDAVYRIAADQGPNPSFSAAQIARALAARDVPHPALASLATAAARYAALAAQKKLDPSLKLDRFPAERRAARDELRAALAGLGGSPGEAPNNVLDDVTELTDGLVATLSAALADASSKKSATKAGACAAKTGALSLDPTTRRALARLGDVRGRILAHPRYKQGDSLWARRVRLLVTVLSDAMDVAIASDTGHKPAFQVDAAAAQRVIEDAMRELDQKAITEIVAGGYGVLRGIAVAGDPEVFLKKESKDLRRLAAGLVDVFRSDALGGKGPAMGVALLDALGALKLAAVPASEDATAALVTYAGAFYAKNQPDQGDLCLLAALVLTSLSRTPPSQAAIDLADKVQSRVAWAYRFSRETRKSGEVPDPAAYAEGLRRATDDACQAPDAEATIAVMQAIHDFATGKRKEARAALDRVLDEADAKGLGVPRMSYRYEEKTATKIFTVNVDISYGSGVLAAGNNFQLGLGFRTAGEPEGSLTATLAPAESQKAGEDAARYYVVAAALATVYHLLEGDTDRGVASGRRAVSALSFGLKLGSRTLRAERPGDWGSDAREILLVAAQLAADASLPFLAGDLWTVARQSLPPQLDDKGVAALLDKLPLGLASVKDLGPAIERTKRSLKILAEPLPCTDAKVETGGFEEPACDQYPLALSLRIADVVKKLPRLRRGSEAGPRCGALKSLDTFLASADKGRYEPDAFTHAVEDLRASGRAYDAAVLLARQKHPNHCSPQIVGAARSLGRSAQLGPWLRSDLLSAAVNCTAAAGGKEVEDDVTQLDEDTRKTPDPSRNLQLVLSMADLATRTDTWDMLEKLVDKPDFVPRWMGLHPRAATAALLLDHAAATIAGKAVSVDKTKGAYELLCQTFTAQDRAEMCGMIGSLRKPAEGAAADQAADRPRAVRDDRQRFAKEAVKKLVATVMSGSAPPKRP
jgi:hypothetical protein